MKVSADTLKAEIQDLQSSLLATSREFYAVQAKANTVEETVVDNVSPPPLDPFCNLEQVSVFWASFYKTYCLESLQYSWWIAPAVD